MDDHRALSIVNESSSGDSDGFFLPDLCQTQSLFLLVLVSELLVVILVLAKSGMLHFDWIGFSLTSLFVQWVVLFSAALLCNLRPILARLGLRTATTICFCLVLVSTLVFSILAEWVLQKEPTWDLETGGRIIANLLIAALLTGIAFRYFFIQHQLRSKEKAELNMRIQALQSRIRPHFLFNSMNIIASLIAVDPDAAEEVVEDLSILFRASLQDASNRPVPLTTEVELCRKYLHIEGLRLGDRLKVEWHINLDLDAEKIPLLSLQPLIENAIYHGIQPLASGGLVEIRMNKTANMIKIVVENPVAEEVEENSGGNRMALENIRNRLNALYGDAAGVVTRKENGRFVTNLNYPEVVATKN